MKKIVFGICLFLSLFITCNVKASIYTFAFDKENYIINKDSDLSLGLNVELEQKIKGGKFTIKLSSNYVSVSSVKFDDTFTSNLKSSVVTFESKNGVNISDIIGSIILKPDSTIKDGTSITLTITNIELYTDNDETIEFNDISTVIKCSNKSSDNSLKSLVSKDATINFDPIVTEYSIVVANDLEKLDLSAIPNDSKAKVNISDLSILDDNNKIVITVTAENGDVKEYKINVIKQNKISNESVKSTDSNFHTKWLILTIFFGVLFVINLFIIRLRKK